MILDETALNPLGLGFTVLMCALLLIVPRKYAMFPVIILTCYMTMGPPVVIAGLHFSMLRLLTLVGWARVALRGEMRIGKLSAIDKALIWWVVSSVITYSLLWQTSEAFIYRGGLAYNAIGMYFLFRFLVRDFDDIFRVLKVTAVLVIPLAASMAVEKMNGTNAFSILGGVPVLTAVREGALRCQGPFRHPILAGTFGATLMPLFVVLWWRGGKSRLLGAIAILASAVITLTSASSGPVGAFMAALVALSLWRVRKHLGKIRWAIVVAVVGLEIAMKSHVWWLLARVGFFAGSDAWHRAFLIDRTVFNFSDWWLVGTKSTEKWGSGLWDLTNAFVAEGAGGGLVTMLLFIAIIWRCFQGIGRAVRVASREERELVWGLGAALMAHVATFFSVTYFDQNYVNWYLLLAMISLATSRILAAGEAKKQWKNEEASSLPSLNSASIGLTS